MLRAGLSPKIPGLRVKSIDGFKLGPVIVVRVPKSWTAPHMVIFKNLSRFFTRTSAGKHQLDVHELRNAFMASTTLRDKISQFRNERLGRILANETPVRMSAEPKIILHLIPFTIADTSSVVDLSPVIANPTKTPPLDPYGQSHRINIDGIVTYTAFSHNKPSHTYLQVFRFGAFEAVNSQLLRNPNGEKLIDSSRIERALIKGLTCYLRSAKELGIQFPFLLSLTLHGVHGYLLNRNSKWSMINSTETVDRETLVLPDVIIEQDSLDPDLVLRPVFDALWQASGFASCEHYNCEGRWDGGQSRE